MSTSNKELAKESVSNLKRARGFIFVVGMALIALGVYLFVSNQSALPQWGNLLNGAVLALGIGLTLAAKYSKSRTIVLLEKLMTGWP